MTPPISLRAARLLDNPPPDYILAHFDRVSDSWEAESNPDGYIAMCLAENKLVWDLLEPKMADCRDIEHHVVGYDQHSGAAPFRRALAEFMGRTFIGRKVDPDNIAVVNGAGTVLELIFYVLCDPGDGVLVPTPSYMGFWPDLETRDEVSIIPVHCLSENGFELTRDLLDAAVANADRPIKALLYTNPSNPLGCVYSAEEVEDVLSWAQENEIHVVLDEIYALSTFGDVDFTSGAKLRPDMGDSLHIVWAFSKDFGMSGLRSGVLFTENQEVLQAVEGLAMWAQTSGDTQSLLRQILSDEEWVDGYLAESQRRLGNAYRQTTKVLDEYDISYIPAVAGFFILVDVRPLMDEISWEAEERLWRHLVEELNINLTPGASCHNGEPGFMRLVFSGVPTDAVVAGVDRLGRYAQSLARG